jgi:thiol-disulfide isomerase/thioredoxin
MKNLIAVLLGCVVFGCAAGKPSKDAPDFELQRITRLTKTSSITPADMLKSSDLKGKVVVIDFWATWCDPCKEEIPGYNQMAGSMPEGATLVSIAMDSGNVDEVTKSVGQLGIQYPVLMGKDDIDEKFGGLRGYPTTFVLDKNWKIYKKYEGLVTGKQDKIKKDIAALLAS